MEKKVGRPQKTFDKSIFEELCNIQCTHEEIANVLHTTKDTLYVWCEREYGDNFSTIYKKYSDGGKISLRRMQFNLAEKNPAMAIWLGKQYLGQKDIQVVESSINGLKEVTDALKNVIGEIDEE